MSHSGYRVWFNVLCGLLVCTLTVDAGWAGTARRKSGRKSSGAAAAPAATVSAGARGDHAVKPEAPPAPAVPDGAIDPSVKGYYGPTEEAFNRRWDLDGVATANVLVNSRQLCPNGRGLQQNETAIVVSGDVVIVAYNDARGVNCPTQRAAIGWSYSLDGGQTFIDGGGLPSSQSLNNGDPWLGVSPDGTTFYLSGLWQGYQGLGFLRGFLIDDQIVWTDPVVIRQGGSMDKEAFVVDHNSGYIYLTYTNLGQGIRMTRSTDSGDTWSPPVTVATGSVQGSFPAVSNQGVIYVAYNIGYPVQNQQTAIARSLDGGQTFQRVAAFPFRYASPVPGLDRTPAFPQIAVDNSGGERDGWVYAVWHVYYPDNVFRPVMTHSEDGGETWSEPTLTHLDGADNRGHRWFPTIAVDIFGYVNTVFYDRRHNPDSNLTDVWLSQSYDGGYTFDERRLSDVTGNWTNVRRDPGFIYGGDYIRAVSYGFDIYAVWTDPRNGDPDIYFSRISSLAAAERRRK